MAPISAGCLRVLSAAAIGRGHRSQVLASEAIRCLSRKQGIQLPVFTTGAVSDLSRRGVRVGKECLDLVRANGETPAAGWHQVLRS